MALINSMAIGFLCIRWIRSKKDRHVNLFSRENSFKDKFLGIRDSLRSRRQQFRDSRRLREFKDRNKQWARKVKKQLSKSPDRLSRVGSFIAHRSPHTANVGTNTDHDHKDSSHYDTMPDRKAYPPLPRYI